MINWRDGEDRLREGSLFGAFAALARGEAWSFPALRPHQREPWHAFTVQVAALALIRAGLDDLPNEEGAWRDLLLALTPEHPGGEAWELVVDDWSKPALLQPPIATEIDKKAYEKVLPSPDRLDMLVTSRNHDVKREQITPARAEDWLFALVTLQTMEGQMGRGNYGISRMNSGYGTRTTLGARPPGGTSAAFGRDVRRLVADAKARPDRRYGIALVWTKPWDGEAAIAYPDLDELYVEVCRRIRIRHDRGKFVALSAGSACSRIAAKDQKGRTNDPWAPIRADGTTSSPAPVNGLGYRQMAKYLNHNETKRPLLADLHEQDVSTNLTIVASALVRGEGGTEGLHRRAVRTSRLEEIEDYGDAEVFDRVGAVAARRAAEASTASGKLKYALYTLLQGAPSEEGRSKRLQVRMNDKASEDRAKVWLALFDHLVDREFFDKPFWAEAANGSEAHAKAWRARLRDLTTKVFDEAAEAAPRTEMRRIRAVARAKSALDGVMQNWLKEVADGE